MDSTAELQKQIVFECSYILDIPRFNMIQFNLCQAFSCQRSLSAQAIAPKFCFKKCHALQLIHVKKRSHCQVICHLPKPVCVNCFACSAINFSLQSWQFWLTWMQQDPWLETGYQRDNSRKIAREGKQMACNDMMLPVDSANF